MKTDGQRPLELSRRKRILFSLFTCAFAIVVILVLAEAFTRLKGFAPLRPVSLIISMEPKGNYFIPHPTRGFAHPAGEFKLTVPGPYTFKMTHANNGLRITHPLAQETQGNKKEIWIFGCSLTHGWRLNDEETYPWLLQRDLPAYEVVNFGVDGYGTVQSLIQLQESLKSGNKPAIVVLAYGDFHDGRNVLARGWKKQVFMNNRLGALNYPDATLGSDNKLVFRNDPLTYWDFALVRYSALANYLDSQYNDSIGASYRGHDVSKAVVNEFWKLCEANGIAFVLAGIYSSPTTAEMLKFFSDKGAMTVDISVDLSIRENTSLPWDGHPNALANKQYAQKIESFLRAKLIDRPGPPAAGAPPNSAPGQRKVQ